MPTLAGWGLVLQCGLRPGERRRLRLGVRSDSAAGRRLHGDFERHPGSGGRFRQLDGAQSQGARREAPPESPFVSWLQ